MAKATLAATTKTTTLATFSNRGKTLTRPRLGLARPLTRGGGRPAAGGRRRPGGPPPKPQNPLPKDLEATPVAPRELLGTTVPLAVESLHLKGS